ncbi:MAG: FKBP-type peptidyl-prolyl cis-trans isomerase [Dehalococcoidales bacterium]|nr:FKBP-type peptidyl-prolyl cis-trans isomerase [Dehalococcoidales bacterium]
MKKYLILISLALFFSLILTGCGIASAKNGDTVKLHYSVLLEDGTLYETSIGNEPLEFTIGQGKVLSVLEEAIIGMRVGESKSITITEDQAYGPYREDMVFQLEKKELPAYIDPKIGMQLQMIQGNSEIIIVTIIEINETTLRMDANHPLAGHDLIFEIELVDIKTATSSSDSLISLSLEEAFANGLPTIAEFGSSTCIPCKQMKPILEELAVEYKDKLNVVIIEVYEQRALTQQHNIITIPTQIIFDSTGKEITRHIGLWEKDDIIAQLIQLGIE